MKKKNSEIARLTRKLMEEQEIDGVMDLQSSYPLRLAFLMMW